MRKDGVTLSDTAWFVIDASQSGVFLGTAVQTGIGTAAIVWSGFAGRGDAGGLVTCE